MNRLFFSLALFSTAALAQVSAVDSSGKRIALAAPAQRIVSLAPHVTELLFAAGAGAKVVAVSEYSDYPETAKALPRVASSSSVDLERVLALRADLAVAWRLSATSQSLDRLQAIGVPVFYSEPHRLSEIPDAVETLGILAGTQDAARPAAAALRAELERLHADYRGRRVLKVFYQISERPLMTVSGQHFLSDVLSLCGGRNLFADAPHIAPTVNAEAVLAADPEVIIAARGDSENTGWQDYWKRFPDIRAVRDGNFITVRASEMHRHGPRVFAATRRLCEQLEQARRRAGPPRRP